MTKKHKTENVISKKYIWLEVLFSIICMSAVFAIGYFTGKRIDMCVRNVVMTGLLFVITGYIYRHDFVVNLLDYNNNDYYFRFCFLFLISFFYSILVSFLPTGAWPFIPVFLVLSLFSNPFVGVVSSSLLLTLACLLAEVGISVFALYFICGVFTICLFKNLKNETEIFLPVTMSLMCLFLCMTGNFILIANERPGIEMFILPCSNIIISGIIIFAILKLFFAKVVYFYRDQYLRLNDSENETMLSLKKAKKEDFYQSIHTSYFCERIALKLGLNIEACKCSGLYYLLATNEEYLHNNTFPPKVREILDDNIKSKTSPKYKETVILRMSAKIVGSIHFMQQKYDGNQVDYIKIIDATFKYFEESNLYDNSDISMGEIKECMKVFKEEKLYYDFLR